MSQDGSQGGWARGAFGAYVCCGREVRCDDAMLGLGAGRRRAEWRTVIKAVRFLHVIDISARYVRVVIRRERLVHATTLVLVVMVICLGPFAAPCASWIDGPCQTNWASSARWTLLPLVAAFAMASVVVLMRESVRRARQALRQLSE